MNPNERENKYHRPMEVRPSRYFRHCAMWGCTEWAIVGLSVCCRHKRIQIERREKGKRHG